MPEAGWYDDPQGGGGKRWWDGERWSEHTTPPPGSMPAAPAAPTAPAAPQTDTWQQQPAAGAATWQPAAATPGAGTPAKKGGGGKIVAIILVLVVVVGIGVVAAVLLSGSDDVDTAGPVAGEPAGRDATTGGIQAGQLDGQVVRIPAQGTWEQDVVFPAGATVIDVRGLDGFDPVLEVYDASGASVGLNDDRSFSQLERFGGDILDSLLELDLDAGTYRLEVRGFAGRGGEATVEFPVLGD